MCFYFNLLSVIIWQFILLYTFDIHLDQIATMGLCSSNSNMVLEAATVTRMTALLRIVKHGYSLSWFKHRVFPYLGPNQKEIIQLRSYCKLFRDALKPPPLYTIFPHPNYPTLNEFMDKLNYVYQKIQRKHQKLYLF